MTTTTISLTLPDAPIVPGLRFRLYRDEDDLPARAEVARVANAANGDTEHISLEMLQSQYRNASHIAPGEGVVLAFVDDRLVAFSSVEYSDTTAGERYYRSEGNVHPQWRRRGINLAQARRYVRAYVGHLMLRPDMEGIDTPPLPDGLELVTRCRLASRASSTPRRARAQGYLRGWTNPVFTRRPWRRRGLASALLGHTLAALRDRGMTPAQSGVDSENPFQALTLYERHRYEVVRSTSQWQKPLEP